MLRRWTKEEKDLVIRSNESCAALAVQLDRTEQAVQNIRTKATAKGQFTANKFRNEVHSILLTHMNQITDELDALYGLYSSDKGYDRKNSVLQ